MRYITLKELTDKNNNSYNNKIVSRRTIFRILKKYRNDEERFSQFSTLSMLLKNNTMINEDFLYLFYKKEYKRECKKYSEISINLNDDYKHDYYVCLAEIISRYFNKSIQYSIEKKDKRFHIHILCKTNNIDKDLFVNFLNSELQIQKGLLSKNVNIAEVRDLDKYYNYIIKSSDIREIKRDM